MNIINKVLAATVSLKNLKESWAKRYPDHVVDNLEKAHHAHKEVVRQLEDSTGKDIDKATSQRIHKKIKEKLGVSKKQLNAQYGSTYIKTMPTKTPAPGFVAPKKATWNKHPPHIAKKLETAHTEYTRVLENYKKNNQEIPTGRDRAKLLESIKAKHGVSALQLFRNKNRENKLAASDKPEI